MTLVEAMDRLLPAEEPGHSRILARALKGRGVDVRLGAAVESAETTEEGVAVRIGGETLTTDLLLVAVGRRPIHRRAGAGGGRGGGDRRWASLVVDDSSDPGQGRVHAAGDVVEGLVGASGLRARPLPRGTDRAPAGQASGGPPSPRDTDIPRITYSTPRWPRWA